MKRRFGFIIALAVLVLGASVLSVVPVSAYTVVHGLYGRYWRDSFFGIDLPPPPACVDYAMPPPGPYPPPTLEQIDPTINFKGTVHPPEWNWRPFGDFEFSVKWSGYINIPEAGVYWFRLWSDDGSWLFIDGTLVINRGGIHAPGYSDGSIGFKVPGSHQIVIDFYETCDTECGIVFEWKPPLATEWTIVPSDVLIPEPLPNVTVPEFGLALPMVISLAAAALFIGKRRWLKITP